MEKTSESEENMREAGKITSKHEDESYQMHVQTAFETVDQGLVGRFRQFGKAAPSRMNVNTP